LRQPPTRVVHIRRHCARTSVALSRARRIYARTRIIVALDVVIVIAYRVGVVQVFIWNGVTVFSASSIDAFVSPRRASSSIVVRSPSRVA
jgi:hypothetical protein